MKKTMSLLGLFFAGVALLANPRTGILAATSSDTETVVTTVTTTLSGDPPAEAESDVVIDTEAETAVVSESAETATATAEATTTTESADSYSVVGSAEASRYGTFQVEVYFENGEIVAIDTLQAPSDHHSDRINSQAIPSYEAAIIAAQSTDIDVLSGATVTWQSYTASVQAALDSAGFSS